MDHMSSIPKTLYLRHEGEMGSYTSKKNYAIYLYAKISSFIYFTFELLWTLQ